MGDGGAAADPGLVREQLDESPRAMPAKRQRTTVKREDLGAADFAPRTPGVAPPAIHLGRRCCLRWPQTAEWVTGTLLAYKGADKQSCEVKLDDGRVKKVHLGTQAIHVACDVVWGPPDEEAEEEALRGGGWSRREGCAVRCRQSLPSSNRLKCRYPESLGLLPRPGMSW